MKQTIFRLQFLSVSLLLALVNTNIVHGSCKSVMALRMSESALKQVSDQGINATRFQKQLQAAEFINESYHHMELPDLASAEYQSAFGRARSLYFANLMLLPGAISESDLISDRNGLMLRDLYGEGISQRHNQKIVKFKSQKFKSTKEHRAATQLQQNAIRSVFQRYAFELQEYLKQYSQMINGDSMITIEKKRFGFLTENLRKKQVLNTKTEEFYSLWRSLDNDSHFKPSPVFRCTRSHCEFIYSARQKDPLKIIRKPISKVIAEKNRILLQEVHGTISAGNPIFMDRFGYRLTPEEAEVASSYFYHIEKGIDLLFPRNGKVVVPNPKLGKIGTRLGEPVTSKHIRTWNQDFLWNYLPKSDKKVVYNNFGHSKNFAMVFFFSKVVVIESMSIHRATYVIKREDFYRLKDLSRSDFRQLFKDQGDQGILDVIYHYENNRSAWTSRLLRWL